MQHTVSLCAFRCAWMGLRHLGTFVPPFHRDCFHCSPNHESVGPYHEEYQGTYRATGIFSGSTMARAVSI